MKTKLTVLFCLLQLCAFAQEYEIMDLPRYYEYRDSLRHKRVYTTWGGEGPLLTYGSVKYAGEHITSIPRFTFFFNLGNNWNYNFSNQFGVFTGLNIKNIGVITQEDSIKIKRRVYTLGVPVGFKVGDLRRGKVFFFAGGSYDLAFNYKEKKFVNGHKVDKFNEWFSDRTPILMPSVFAGIRIAVSLGFKLQYYPTVFNKDVKSNLFLATMSYDFGGVPFHEGIRFRVKRKPYKP
jgi:hypothetical protein